MDEAKLAEIEAQAGGSCSGDDRETMLALIAEVRRLRDDPTKDDTDEAHPAWWRGYHADKGELAHMADVANAEARAARARVALLEAERDEARAKHQLAGVALAAEVRRLRAIIEGRTTPPTPGERVAHLRATGGDGRWRLRRGALDLIGAFHGSVLLADAMTATDARWWAIDADGRPCAWPSAKGGA